MAQTRSMKKKMKNFLPNVLTEDVLRHLDVEEKKLMYVLLSLVVR